MKLKKSELWIIWGMISYVIYTYIANYQIMMNLTSYELFEVPPNSILFSLAHALMSSFIAIYFFRIVEKTMVRCTRSMCFVAYFTICVYNMCSSCKYLVSPLFPGLVENNTFRLLGSALSDIIMVISLFIWDRVNSKHYDLYFDINKYIYGNHLLEVALIAVYALKVISVHVGRNFFSVENGTLDNFINTFLCLLCMLTAVINMKTSLKNIRSFIPVVVIFVISVIDAMFTGKRNDLAVPIVYFITICYGLGKMNIKLFRALTAAAPLGLAVVSKVIYSVSKRGSTMTDYWYLRDQVYRFDLTDLASTISSRFKLNYISLETIRDGIISAIPGVTWESAHYSKFMKLIGLSGTEDYSDTIFSVGTELMGYIGMIVVPIVILIYLEWLDNRFKQSKYYNVRYIRFVIIFHFAIAETTWAMFILNARNMVLAVLLGMVFLRVILVAKKRTQLQSFKLNSGGRI